MRWHDRGMRVPVVKIRCPAVPLHPLATLFVSVRQRGAVVDSDRDAEVASLGNGAGDGNRTHVSSLGSYSSTIELRPLEGIMLFDLAVAQQLRPTCRAWSVSGCNSLVWNL